MQLRLPKSLHYPITVTGFLKKPEQEVSRFDPLFSYLYKTKVTEGDRWGGERQVEKLYPTTFESTFDGSLKKWTIKVGDIIETHGVIVAEIEEPCAHDVQFCGMCGQCGKDMTELSYNTSQSDETRAQIHMTYDNVPLRVSEDEATRVEEVSKRRLLQAKKLSLVVDLDQTVIHATVEDTVRLWMEEPNHPEHEAVKDVSTFQLTYETGGQDKNTYFVKQRPGLNRFLENMCTIFELHVYTMGTRAYARKIIEIIDKDKKIFGDRILSRDESGSLVAKNLQRLFPTDTRMVLIIDDRGDVWKWNENLIRVQPFEFFLGVGDINASFLPKIPKAMVNEKTDAIVLTGGDEEPTLTIEGDIAPAPNGIAISNKDSNVMESGDTLLDKSSSALDILVSMGGGDDPNLLQEQTTQHGEALAAQAQEKPLLQKQKELEAAQIAELSRLNEIGAGEEALKEAERPRRSLLPTHDHELYYLEKALRRVHAEFFQAYEIQLASARGGRVGELRGVPSSRKNPLGAKLDLQKIPDIKVIMPNLKRKVLEGVVIVFSSVIPLGVDIQKSEVALWAKSFGARVETKVSRQSTTHVVAARNGTSKVKQAFAKGRGRIKVVGLQWLTDSIVQWVKLDESPYLLDEEEANVGRPDHDETDMISDDESLTSIPNIEVDTSSRSKLVVKTRYNTDEDDEDLEALLPGTLEDENSPLGGSNDDWKDMHDEMAEFLGSDVDDSDNDSVSSAKSVHLSMRNAKRSHDQMNDGSNESTNGTTHGRKKLAISRSTHLVLSQTTDAADLTDTGEEASNAMEEGDEIGGDDDDGWGDLEDDLAAEVGKVENQEDAGEG